MKNSMMYLCLVLGLIQSVPSNAAVTPQKLSCHGLVNGVDLQAVTSPLNGGAQVQLFGLQAAQCKDPRWFRYCRHLAFSEPVGEPFQVAMRSDGPLTYLESSNFKLALKLAPADYGDGKTTLDGVLLVGTTINGIKIDPRFTCSWEKSN